MTIEVISKRTEKIIFELLNIWENSVLTTHIFLTKSEIDKIKEYVPSAINNVEHLIIVKNDGKINGFIGINNQKIEMLFIDSNERNKGLGKSLIEYSIKNYNVKEVTVNVDNKDALGFYEHLGFTIYKRAEHDEEGNNYPLYYMEYRKKI